MYASQTLTLLALAVLSTATPLKRQDNSTTVPEPITIGQFSYSHGHSILAWTPTKTTLTDACGGSGTTELQSVNTDIYSGPLCGVPFELDGQSGLTLECADGTDVSASQVTAVSTNGQVTHQCVGLPETIGTVSCGVGAGIAQIFACQ